MSIFDDTCKYIETKLKENNGIENMIKKYFNFINDLSDNIGYDKDIELIWKIHLLHPTIYRSDYYKYFGRIITPQNMSLNTYNNTGKPHKNITKMDLKGSLLNQYSFMQKVLTNKDLINPTDKQVKSWINDYKKFMKIIGKTNKIIVPTLGIDIIWHTHMYNHDRYFNDSIALSGKFVKHDDLIDDNILQKEFKKTEILLKQNNNDKNGSNMYILFLKSILTVFVGLLVYIYKYIYYDSEYINARRLLAQGTRNAVIFGIGFVVVIALLCVCLYGSRDKKLIKKDMKKILKEYGGSFNEREQQKYALCGGVNLGLFKCCVNYNRLVDEALFELKGIEFTELEMKGKELLLKIPNENDRAAAVERWKTNGFDDDELNLKPLNSYARNGANPGNNALILANQEWRRILIQQAKVELNIGNDSIYKGFSMNEFMGFRTAVANLKNTMKYKPDILDEIYNTVVTYNTIVDKIVYKRKEAEWNAEYAKIVELVVVQTQMQRPFIDTIAAEVKRDLDVLFESVYSYCKMNTGIVDANAIRNNLVTSDYQRYKILNKNLTIIAEAFTCRTYYNTYHREYWVVYYGGSYGGCGGGGG